MDMLNINKEIKDQDGLSITPLFNPNGEIGRDALFFPLSALSSSGL